MCFVHRFILHNEEIREASDRILSPGQVGLLSGWGVFSTIRVRDGVLFAFERHWARMSRDAQLFGVPFLWNCDELRSRLLQLVEANQAPDCTLRVTIVRNYGGMWEGPVAQPADLIALTADLKAWGDGVKLRYVPQGRHSGSPFAGAKILSWAMNLTWLEQAQAAGFDEVILLNERGEVSECTSANIFVANGNQVWTPPLQGSGCLPGITRELLFDIPVAGFRISERTLMPKDLEEAGEVFITSTTRELLPVHVIGDMKVRNRGGARAALQTAFSEYEDRYIAEHGRAPAATR